MSTTNATPVWTLEPGRTLCADGIPLAYLARVGDDAKGYALSPWGADGLAHRIVDALSRIAELERTLEAVTAQRDQCAEALAGALKSPWFASVGADSSTEADAMRAALANTGGVQ